MVAVWASAGWGTYPDIDHGIATHAPLILVKMTIGASFSLVTDSTWKVAPSNIISTGGGPGGGDTLDDSAANPNWNTVGLNDSGWKQASNISISSYPDLHISADAMEPTRRHSTIPASTVTAIEAVQVRKPPRTDAELHEAHLAKLDWWGPATLRAKPHAEPFCGHCGLDPGGTTTEYEELKLACLDQSDTIATIDFAVWGVPTGGSTCSSWQAGDPCGSVAETTKWVESLCIGKQSCTLDPIHRNGKWDPCPDKKKVLAVTATCKSGPGNATVVITGPTPPPPPGPPPPGTWLVTMAELYTGWFEVHNMAGAPGSTVHFQVRLPPPSLSLLPSPWIFYRCHHDLAPFQ